MNIKAESVSGSVKKSLRPSLFFPRGKPLSGKKVDDPLMNALTLGAGPDLGDGIILSHFHRPKHGTNPFGGFPFQQGSGHVTVVSGRFRPRKDVDDNGLACPQGPLPSFVGIITLWPARGNCMHSMAPFVQNGLLDQASESPRGETFATEPQFSPLFSLHA